MSRSFGLRIATGLCVGAVAGGYLMPAMAQESLGPAQHSQATDTKSASSDQPRSDTALVRFGAWPIIINDPRGVFAYATEGATNIGISPYQNNLAIGFQTLNPATHHSSRCNSSAGFDGFCGDEVAYGDFTLQHDVTGRDNTAIGDHALANVTSAEGNTAVGSSAAANIHAAGGVDAFGVAACQNATDYRGPVTCIGQASLEFAEQSSGYTVAVGYQAGLHTRLAEYSTILGTQSGFNAATNSYSILVGEAACRNATSVRNVICIGTINGPDRGSMADTLWVGGNRDTVPILYGNLTKNALAVNTTTLIPGAALTLAQGNLALPAGHSVQWNGDASIARVAAGKLVVGNGIGTDASGTLELSQINLSSKATISAASEGELDVGDGHNASTGGHIVAAYLRTAPTRVASLSVIDASPELGDRALVTDAKNCTFGVTVLGGGSTACPLYYNGRAWVAG
jgi:hypothetical protein